MTLDLHRKKFCYYYFIFIHIPFSYTHTHTHTHTHIFIYIYLHSYHHHHHHHVVPLARISLTLSNSSLSFIASGRSSGLHPVSSHSYCMYVRAGRPTFAWLYAVVHRSTSLMSSSLLLQQCPACLVRLTMIVFVMGGRWPYSSALWVVTARACSIFHTTFLCKLPSSFFVSRLVSIQVVHPYSSIDTTAAWKNLTSVTC